MKTYVLQLKSLLCLASLLLILGLDQQSFAQTTVYGYAYLTISSSGDRAEIYLVTPGGSIVERHPFPLPEGLIFSPRFRSVVSPDGRWIASTLFAADQSRLVIHLFDVARQEGYEIVEGFMHVHGKNVVWSPDSRYLAMNIRLMNEQSIDLYVYNTSDGSLINVSNDSSEQRDIAWSHDNMHLLTFSHPCPPNESCSDHLALFDVWHGALVNSVDLVELPFLGNSACNPKLSPDHRIVSFVSNCGVGVPFSYDFPNEIYIWDIDSGKLIQTTDYAQGQTGAGFQARYDHEWLDEQMLLIGTNYRRGNNPEQQQLVVYDLLEEAVQILSTNTGSEFEISAVSDQVVFLSRPVFSDQPESDRKAQLSLGILTSVQVGAAESIVTSASVANACEATFAPMGGMIAVTASQRDCTLFLDRVTFINLDTNMSETYLIETTEPYVMMLGWVMK